MKKEMRNQFSCAYKYLYETLGLSESFKLALRLYKISSSFFGKYVMYTVIIELR